MTPRAPLTALVRRNDTHRLIPSQHRDGGAPCSRASRTSDAELADLFDLDNATNDRLLAENDLLPDIRVHELLFGVPYYRIVNASFTHAHPLGSRFNGPDRGAWYAAFEIRTAQAEVAFHKTLHLEEIGRFDDDVTFDDYLADFSCELHDLRGRACIRGVSRSRTATSRRRRSRRGCWTRDRSASSIRACVAPAARASRASGRHW